MRTQADATDSSLVAQIQTGNEEAMAAIYDRYAQVVYSVALRVLGDTGAAEDVMQEIFMQLWRNPHAFNANRGSLGAWLAVISRHRAIDALRKRKPETDLEEVIVSVEAPLATSSDRALFADKIRDQLRSLPADQQRAMEMAFFEGFTHAEIAEKTGVPLGTIKTRIRSGLITLRKALGVVKTA